MRRLNSAVAGLFPLLYTFLVLNALLVVANLPAWVALASVSLADAWAVPLALSVTLAPSLAAVFAAFERFGEGSTTPVVDFLRAYRRLFARAFVLGLGVLAVVLVCAADVVFFAGSSVGALLTPVCVVVAALALAGGLVALMLLAGAEAGAEAGGVGESRQARPRLSSLCMRGGFLAVRLGFWSLINLAVGGIAVIFVVAQPILGAFLGPSVLLYVAWSNTRYARVRCRDLVVAVA